MPKPQVTFRNDVIHKGRIPLKEEAVSYVNDVLGLIMPLLIEMKKTMVGSLWTLQVERMKERRGAPGQTPQATMSITSAVSLTLSLTEPHPTTIESSLKRIEEKRFKG
jgi:hypothetical protein